MVKVSVKDVDQHEMVKQVGNFLKKSGKVKVPEWADVVKLGNHKELGPTDIDWYYTRTAAVARRLYIRSPIGNVSTFFLCFTILCNFFVCFIVLLMDSNFVNQYLLNNF